MAKKSYFPIRISNLPHDDPRYLRWKESLKKRPQPWNKGYTKENHPSLLKTSQTFKKLKIDNFALWRKHARLVGLIPSSYSKPRKDYKLAFLIGLILGDGNLYKFPRTECLRIVLGTDKPLLINYTKTIIKDVFGKESTSYKRKKSECVDIRIYQKKLSIRLGIPLGARGKLIINLPSWVWRKKEYLTFCLKGLFEAEGSYSIHIKTYTYNFSFSNMNTSLLDEVQKSLTRLGYHPERRYNAVRLRKKIEVLNFAELIQFRKYESV